MKCNMTDRLGQLPRWEFQDAEAQFEFLVRLAAGGAPQCIALCETDAVVVVSYDHYRSMARSDGSLLEFFRSSPLVGTNVQLDRIAGDVREVEL